MSKVKGTVSGAGKGKFSFFITLEETEGFYYNTKYEPKCGKGDVVGIEFEQKGAKRGNIKKVVVLEKNSSGYDGGGDSGGWDDAPAKPSGGGSGGNVRQDSIIWQHSQEMAVRLASTLVTTESIKLPKNPDARRLIIESLVDELTLRYFKDAENPRVSKAFTEADGIEADASGDEGGDDWDAPDSGDFDDSWDD